jgi:formylglycine-generating enzyme required for sulfatase activity
VSAKLNAQSDWAIYLADAFDNLVLLREETGYALLEPTPIAPRKRPPVIPEQIDLANDSATVFIQDVYAGPGLRGVPRGTARKLRLLAYHFGYRGLAGSDKIGYGGPWEAMRILGTVPLEKDGSANFTIPANTPVAVQVLDREGKAIQLMRSWFTAMPGENVSCAGCHEAPNETIALKKQVLAANEPPRDLVPWYGPARGFDFEREVQPVLDQHCVRCHDAKEPGRPDLRSAAQGGKATPKPIGYVPRLHKDMMRDTGGKMTYTPAYDVLIHYIRRVGIEDDVSLLTPGEYHADTSELIQMLQQGHHDVQLDPESWDRLVTWIDLNGPCHGTWNEVYPIPDAAHERRMELRKRYGGPAIDPEHIPTAPKPLTDILPPSEEPPLGNIVFASSPPIVQYVPGPVKTLDMGDGIRMALTYIPGGEFWMGACEVSNEQYRRFDPDHDSGYYAKRRDRPDGKGLTLSQPKQPALRVSWGDAAEFCGWLSARTGLRVSLPTAAEWAYACNAGKGTPLNYGAIDADFSRHGNMADKSFSTGVNLSKGRMMPEGGVTQATGGVPHLVLEGAKLADTRFDDGQRVTAPVGSYQPNVWGLFDMHGNVAEWTSSEHKGEKLVLGGSFFDRPERCRSSLPLSYPFWQRVFNVGFRIVVKDTIIVTQNTTGDSN